MLLAHHGNAKPRGYGRLGGNRGTERCNVPSSGQVPGAVTASDAVSVCTRSWCDGVLGTPHGVGIRPLHLPSATPVLPKPQRCFLWVILEMHRAGTGMLPAHPALPRSSSGAAAAQGCAANGGFGALPVHQESRGRCGGGMHGTWSSQRLSLLKTEL